LAPGLSCECDSEGFRYQSMSVRGGFSRYAACHVMVSPVAIVAGSFGIAPLMPSPCDWEDCTTARRWRIVPNVPQARPSRGAQSLNARWRAGIRFSALILRMIYSPPSRRKRGSAHGEPQATLVSSRLTQAAQGCGSRHRATDHRREFKYRENPQAAAHKERRLPRRILRC
jgi:hypothetical protein